MALKDDFNPPKKSPITKRELDGLEEQQNQSPEATYDLTSPDGGNNPENDADRANRQKRIDHLKDEFQKLKDRSRNSFNRANGRK